MVQRETCQTQLMKIYRAEFFFAENKFVRSGHFQTLKLEFFAPTCNLFEGGFFLNWNYLSVELIDFF